MQLGSLTLHLAFCSFTRLSLAGDEKGNSSHLHLYSFFFPPLSEEDNVHLYGLVRLGGPAKWAASGPDWTGWAQIGLLNGTLFFPLQRVSLQWHYRPCDGKLLIQSSTCLILSKVLLWLRWPHAFWWLIWASSCTLELNCLPKHLLITDPVWIGFPNLTLAFSAAQTLLCPNEKGCVSCSSLSHTLQAAEHAVRLSDLLCAKHRTHRQLQLIRPFVSGWWQSNFFLRQTYSGVIFHDFNEHANSMLTNLTVPTRSLSQQF